MPDSLAKKPDAIIQKYKIAEFTRLYKQHWKELYLIAYRFTGKSDEAKDIVQEVFLSLLEKFEEKQIRNIHAYLIQALKYKCFNWLRNSKIAEKHLKRINQIASANTTEESIDFLLATKAVGNAVTDLPEKCQQVFRLSRFEHLTHEEIASRLDISPKTVENYITRALKKMRMSLKKEEIIISITVILLVVPH